MNNGNTESFPPRRRSLVAVALGLSLIAAPGLSFPASQDQEAAEKAEQEAVAAMKAKDVEKAISGFRRAAELEPDNPERWFKLGRYLARLEDWDGAIEAYEKVVALDPKHAKALNNMGNVYYRRGNHELAAESYGKALDVDPDYQLAAFHHGWMLKQLNRVEEAEQSFNRCLSLEPKDDREIATHLNCKYYFGTLRFRAGDYETTASIMEEIIYYRRTHVEARYYLAMSYLRLGREEEGREQLEIHKKLVRMARSQEPTQRQPDP
jgi:tetratricopeptide (TPR) repeat protein